MRGEQYLTKPQQFALVYDKGSSCVNRFIVMKVLPNGLTVSRFGLSVSKKVGIAVVRNKVKRRLREIIRHSQLKPGLDIVIIARVPVSGTDYSSLERAVQALLIKSRVTARSNEETGAGTN